MSGSKPTGGGGRPGGGAMGTHGGGSAGVVAIDPVKLLQKYAWLFAGAGVVGVVLGIGMFLMLKTFAPRFTAEVIFRCLPAQTQIENMVAENVDKDEMDRFLATQVSMMRAEQILFKVAGDRRLAAEAPNWVEDFPKTSGNADRAEELADITRARVIPGTDLIKLSVEYRKAIDAAGLVSLIKEIYLDDLGRLKKRDATRRIDTFAASISEVDRQIQALNDRRSRLVADEELDSVDATKSAARQELELVLKDKVEVMQSIEMLLELEARDDAMLASDAGIQYDDTLRADTEMHPRLMRQQQMLDDLEAARAQMRLEGLLEGHRSVMALEAQIEATEQELGSTREQLLRQAFDARLDSTKQSIAQYRARESELLSKEVSLNKELNDLTSILSEIEEIDRRSANALELRAQFELDLAGLRQQASLEDVSRVIVFQPERVPNEMSFPKPLLIVPLTTLLFCGFVGGVVVLREMLDQRVKSAADVAMIPRTKIVGCIPSALEDPTEPKAIETVFRDAPDSILTESYRQVRTPLLKTLERGGHKSLVVVGGQPGSGTTSVVANLGFACAASELKVLLVDANFRRPTLHKVFGVEESGGLSDVLRGEVTLADAVRPSGTDNLSVLSAGTPSKRVVEHLGGEAMASLLAEAAEEYDLVLLDTTPAIVSGDALALANRADASMLVVRAMGEKRGLVARVGAELSDCRAEMLGVLLNQVRTTTGGYLRQNIRVAHGYRTVSDGLKKAS